MSDRPTEKKIAVVVSGLAGLPALHTAMREHGVAVAIDHPPRPDAPPVPEQVMFVEEETMYRDSRGADLDETRRYRYRLWRQWGPGDWKHTVGFIMLNPSTADALADDPTIRRCIGYAKCWGFTRLEVGNLFAWRGTDPRLIPRDGVGPRNDDALRAIAGRCRLLVAAWGNVDRKFLTEHALAVEALLEAHAMPGVVLHALGVSKSGRPKHPLYQRANLVARPLAELRRAVIS